MKHCGTKRLETNRLILRRYANEDAAAMIKTGRQIKRLQNF